MSAQIKKKFGQHFLRWDSIVHSMIDAVHIDDTTSVFEIGGGDGFLTQGILQTPVKRLWVFEIDSDWVEHLNAKFDDERLTIHYQDFLGVDFEIFEEHKPWTLLANLPYQVGFPILYSLQKHRHLLTEGVVMLQEEVAQKIVKTGGRGYGFASLFFQYYFEWKLLDKIPPEAFWPPPKVFSRLLYFKPRTNLKPIPDEERFWKFIKVCFVQPRRTFRNNLAQTHYDLEKIPEETLKLRAQQLSFDDLLQVWALLR